MSKIAIVMMQRNEGALLRDWITFHEQIAPAPALHILDNKSTDPLTHFYLSEAQSRGVSVHYGIENFELKGQVVSGLIGQLTETFEYVVPLDCDEFLGVLRNDVFHSTYEEILSDMDNQTRGRETYIRVPHSIWNIPFTTTGYYEDWKKVAVARMRKPELDLGFHLWDFYLEHSTVPAESVTQSSLCYLHFHNAPFERVIASARRKLANRMPDFSQESMDNFKSAGKHLIRYFNITERQYMASFPTGEVDLERIFSEKNMKVPFSI